MQRGLVGSEMCIRDRYQRRVHGNEGEFLEYIKNELAKMAPEIEPELEYSTFPVFSIENLQDSIPEYHSSSKTQQQIPSFPPMFQEAATKRFVPSEKSDYSSKNESSEPQKRQEDPTVFHPQEYDIQADPRLIPETTTIQKTTPISTQDPSTEKMKSLSTPHSTGKISEPNRVPTNIDPVLGHKDLHEIKPISEAVSTQEKSQIYNINEYHQGLHSEKSNSDRFEDREKSNSISDDSPVEEDLENNEEVHSEMSNPPKDQEELQSDEFIPEDYEEREERLSVLSNSDYMENQEELSSSQGGPEDIQDSEDPKLMQNPVSESEESGSDSDSEKLLPIPPDSGKNKEISQIQKRNDNTEGEELTSTKKDTGQNKLSVAQDEEESYVIRSIPEKDPVFYPGKEESDISIVKEKSHPITTLKKDSKIKITHNESEFKEESSVSRSIPYSGEDNKELPYTTSVTEDLYRESKPSHATSAANQEKVSPVKSNIIPLASNQSQSDIDPICEKEKTLPIQSTKVEKNDPSEGHLRKIHPSTHHSEGNISNPEEYDLSEQQKKSSPNPTLPHSEKYFIETSPNEDYKESEIIQSSPSIQAFSKSHPEKDLPEIDPSSNPTEIGAIPTHSLLPQTITESVSEQLHSTKIIQDPLHKNQTISKVSKEKTIPASRKDPIQSNVTDGTQEVTRDERESHLKTKIPGSAQHKLRLGPDPHSSSENIESDVMINPPEGQSQEKIIKSLADPVKSHKRPYKVETKKSSEVYRETENPIFEKSELLSDKNVPNNPSESCLLYTSPSPRDLSTSRMPSSA
eukprot:TRINITY_DN2664_c0_g1_i5.p1 TRINITY_DN2664_c0_g1~~TRINITY_DN2664_c0_g1_i5.p1  ORF type:complete len:802 (-),score=200.82 TRINITY_DN2664_c0_g1_i5:153-2558(-)